MRLLLSVKAAGMAVVITFHAAHRLSGRNLVVIAVRKITHTVPLFLVNFEYGA
jgi:hypothetical protein